AASRILEAVDLFATRALISTTDDGVALSPLSSLVDFVQGHQPEVGVVGSLASLTPNLDKSIPELASVVPQSVANQSAALIVEMLKYDDKQHARRAGSDFLFRNRRIFPPDRHQEMLRSILESPMWQFMQTIKRLGLPLPEGIADIVGGRAVRPPEAV